METRLDNTEYYNMRQCALAQITAKIGWHARTLMDEKTTEIYSLYRKLMLIIIQERLIADCDRDKAFPQSLGSAICRRQRQLESRHARAPLGFRVKNPRSKHVKKD